MKCLLERKSLVLILGGGDRETLDCGKKKIPGLFPILPLSRLPRWRAAPIKITCVYYISHQTADFILRFYCVFGSESDALWCLMVIGFPMIFCPPRAYRYF